MVGIGPSGVYDVWVVYHSVVPAVVFCVFASMYVVRCNPQPTMHVYVHVANIPYQHIPHPPTHTFPHTHPRARIGTPGTAHA